MADRVSSHLRWSDMYHILETTFCGSRDAEAKSIAGLRIYFRTSNRHIGGRGTPESPVRLGSLVRDGYALTPPAALHFSLLHSWFDHL